MMAAGSTCVTPRMSPSAASLSDAPQDGQVAASTGTVAEHHGQVVVSPLSFLRVGLMPLLPLDRRGRLGGDVVHDAIDPRYLVDDSAADLAEDLVRQLRPVGGHAVLRGHRPDCYHVRVR